MTLIKDLKNFLPRIIDKIYLHIECLSKINRVATSSEYENAINYVNSNISGENISSKVHEFDQNGSFWGWRLPDRMNHWKDEREVKYFEIPKKNPLKVLEVFIEGSGKEEILFISHLCHPAPGANDNASGAAMMIELINFFSCNRHHYSMRFIFTVEYWGTVAYFSETKLSNDHIKFCISLDMVGGNQDTSDSSIIVDEIPFNNVENIDLVLWDKIQEHAKKGSYRYIGNAVNSFKLDFQHYTGGSDHYITNSLGIPSTCLNTYPDIHYHTESDTIDKISKDTLELFFKTILDSLDSSVLNFRNNLIYISEIILENFRKKNKSIIFKFLNGKISTVQFSVLLKHIYINSKSRLSKVPSFECTDINISLIDTEYSSIIKKFDLQESNKTNGVKCYYVKNFSGPLSRDLLFSKLPNSAKEFFRASQEGDSLFFHKLDLAIELAYIYELYEVDILTSYYYDSESTNENFEKSFGILSEFGFLEKKST